MSISLLLVAFYNSDSLCMQNAPVGNKKQKEHINLQSKNGLVGFGFEESNDTLEWLSLRMIKQERPLTEQEQGRLSVLIGREARRQEEKRWGWQ